MRVAGITIPKEKRIVVALNYIYGVGPTLSKKILAKAKISENTRTKNLTPEQEDTLRLIIEKEYKTEGDLRREVQANIKRLKDIKAYRGIRHMKHLPVRGQRTKTNSRTVRGNVRKTMGSGRVKEGIKT
ncbi:MAG: 30S ribosomal protein S13 [Candidatus Magasanikbacteria bacterium]|nr:30S ribosomal protein S13 [Candidatus Magasanikbacteria bacterium]